MKICPSTSHGCKVQGANTSCPRRWIHAYASQSINNKECMLLILLCCGMHVVLWGFSIGCSPQPFVPCVLMRQGIGTSIGLLFSSDSHLCDWAMLYWYTIVSCYFYDTFCFFMWYAFLFKCFVINAVVLCVFCDQCYRFVCASRWNKKGWSCHAARRGGPGPHTLKWNKCFAGTYVSRIKEEEQNKPFQPDLVSYYRYWNF